MAGVQDRRSLSKGATAARKLAARSISNFGHLVFALWMMHIYITASVMDADLLLGNLIGCFVLNLFMQMLACA
jgi:hypothetical protein